MQKSSKIVFFGNERLASGFEPHGAPTLQALIDSGYEIAAVISNYERAQSRKARKLEIQEVAEAHNIPVLLPQKLRDIADQIADYRATAGVLVAYGKMVPQSIIDIFPRGIINIHPSLLPAYRGPTPIEQAILDGANKTGVSLMQLVKSMDAGPVYAQAEVPLTGRETKQELTSRLLKRGGELLIKNLPAILTGELKPAHQDESKATYTQLLNKQDAQLDLTKTAAQLERQIRAFATWPKSQTTIFGHTVIVRKAAVIDEPKNDELILACGNNTYLQILELTAPSGRTISGAEFMRGYKNNRD